MYKAEKFAEKAYRITTEFNGKEISFNVVVANDSSELDGLVEVHLNYLRNPNQVFTPQPPSKSIDEVIQELKAELDATKAEVQALKEGKQ